MQNKLRLEIGSVNLNIKEILEKSKLNKENLYYDEPMAKHTSFKIGGPADVFIKVDNIEELKETLDLSKKNQIPLTIIGNGSNLLVTDKGIRGITAKLNLKDIEIKNENNKQIIKVEAGVPVGLLAQKLLKEEITGFEELSGIPGTIGGAVIMNAGAHGKELKDILKKVTAMDYNGNIHEFTNEECLFSYRNSRFQKEKYIILQATLELEKGNSTEIKEKMDVINNEFTLENLDNLIEKLNQKESKENLEKDWEEAIKENEEFDRRKAIRKDLDERTEKAITKNQNKNSEQLNNNEAQPNQPQQSNDNTPQPNQPQQPNNNTPQSNQPQQSNDNKPQPNLQQNIGKIIGIEIVEGSDKINIAKVGEDGQIQNLTIENKLKEILKNKKEIFKNPEVAKIIEEVEPSRFKRHFLKRKLSPVILNVLSENKQGLSIIDYVVAIKKEENCENLKIKHDLSNTVLKGRLKRMMKRVAKTEHFIDGMEVKGLKETKTMGLLESGKRKLKNKPVTIKEGIKLVGKTLGRGTKNGFRQAMKVPKNIKNKLVAVAEKYQDEDLEKLEDKEDPDLEETQPKAQDEEKQEK